MSFDPPSLPPPAPPAGAAEPAFEPPSDPPEVLYKTKAIDFLGRRTSIVLQNDNGPCPLLAICNVLLLKNVINLNPDGSEVSQQKLLSLVAERLIDSNSNVQGKDDEYLSNRERNIDDAINLLPRLATGIDVNLVFTKINNFEFTPECAIFDLLDIPLYHGWIVDPQDTDTAAAIGSKSYNILVPELVAFKTRKATGENRHVVEEETVDFAAATTAALGVPSPSVSRGKSFDENTISDPVSRGKSFDENTISDPVEQLKRRGDIEEEEELRRVLNLSKAEIANAVNGSVSFDTCQSHSSSNLEEAAHTESFRSETPDLVGSIKKEEPGDCALSDRSLLENKTVVANMSEAVSGEYLEALASKEPENMLPKDMNIPVQPSGSTVVDSSHESCAPKEESVVHAPGQTGKETCKELSSVQIHGQAADTEVSCESETAAGHPTASHAMVELDEKNVSLDNPEVVSSSLQGNEPIYQGEEHILGSRNMAYESQEPVYEGEMVLAEQAEKTVKSSHYLEDEAAERQWELIDNFLQNTANQLTVYGLFCLQEGLKERELSVFFRNNHFNTMFKYNEGLYLLATDQGFINQPDLVWEKLDEVNGDGIFMTSNFTPFKAETRSSDSWNEQQAMTSTADYLAQLDSSALPISNSDLELAIALQQQEFDQQPQRYQHSPPQQPQQQQQQQPQQTQRTPLQSSGTGRPGLVVGPRRSNAPPPSRSEPKKDKCIVM